jgi:hypothetical protein
LPPSFSHAPKTRKVRRQGLIIHQEGDLLDNSPNFFQASSPSTTLEDRREKMELDERFGVAEYFIIDPDAGFIEKYMLKRDYADAGDVKKKMQQWAGNNPKFYPHAIERVCVGILDSVLGVILVLKVYLKRRIQNAFVYFIVHNIYTLAWWQHW